MNHTLRRCPMNHRTMKGIRAVALIMVVSFMFVQPVLATDPLSSGTYSLQEQDPTSLGFDSSKWQQVFKTQDSDGNEVLIGYSGTEAVVLSSDGSELQTLSD